MSSVIPQSFIVLDPPHSYDCLLERVINTDVSTGDVQTGVKGDGVDIQGPQVHKHQNTSARKLWDTD